MAEAEVHGNVSLKDLKAAQSEDETEDETEDVDDDLAKVILRSLERKPNPRRTHSMQSSIN